jgi:hypothetical protein
LAATKRRRTSLEGVPVGVMALDRSSAAWIGTRSRRSEKVRARARPGAGRGRAAAVYHSAAQEALDDAGKDACHVFGPVSRPSSRRLLLSVNQRASRACSGSDAESAPSMATGGDERNGGGPILRWLTGFLRVNDFDAADAEAPIRVPPRAALSPWRNLPRHVRPDTRSHRSSCRSPCPESRNCHCCRWRRRSPGPRPRERHR